MASNHLPMQALHPFVLCLVATHLVQSSPAASASSSVWCSWNTAVFFAHLALVLGLVVHGLSNGLALEQIN